MQKLHTWRLVIWVGCIDGAQPLIVGDTGSPSLPSEWIFHPDSRVHVLAGTQVLAVVYSYSCPPPFLGVEGGADFLLLGNIVFEIYIETK